MRQQNGFTLLEMCVVIFVSAILTAGVLALLKNYQKILHREQAIHAVDNSRTLLNIFAKKYFRYPCPANPALTVSDANYGREDCSLPKIAGARDANNNGDLTDDNIMIGILPLYVMNGTQRVYLNEKMDKKEIVNTTLFDPWHNHLTYAVTEKLTIADGDKRYGAIRIIDESDLTTGTARDTAGTHSDAHYVVISHGEDQIGATHLFSGVTDACDSTVYKNEGENCNGDAVFRQSLHYENNNDDYFDDYVSFDSLSDTSIWENRTQKVGTAPATVIGEIRNVNIGSIGIKNTNPVEKLEVGNYAATTPADKALSTVLAQKLVKAKEVCDNTSGQCFLPKTMLSNIGCPAGQYIKGVQLVGTSLSAKCEYLTFQNNPAASAAGQNCGVRIDNKKWLRGLSTNGIIDCTGPAP